MFQDRRYIRWFYFVVDIILIVLAFSGPFVLHPSFVPQDIAAFKSYLVICFFWGMALIFYLHAQDLYSTERLLSIWMEWALVFKSTLFSSVLASLFIFILKDTAFSRTGFIETAVFLILLLSVWRTVKRLYIRHLISRGYLSHHVLIVGAGKMGMWLVEQIQRNPHWGKKIIGYLDDHKTGAINGHDVLGPISGLEDIVNRHYIDEIFVTIPSERAITSRVIALGLRLKRVVRIVAEHFGVPYRNVRLYSMGFIPLITYVSREHSGFTLFLKRAFDITASVLLLVILSPVFLVIVILIKLDSRGPVFYTSQRCGMRGNVFRFYKFRSMVCNADELKPDIKAYSEVSGPIFKMRKDPRITRVGRFLRKYSLDELPQLFNVLKGDMSLVGPRPFPVDESQQIECRHLMRFNIRPGMTGLAQIKGRSELPFSRWMRWDLWYVNNCSLWLDMMILWRTIPAVVKGRGAY